MSILIVYNFLCFHKEDRAINDYTAQFSDNQENEYVIYKQK